MHAFLYRSVDLSQYLFPPSAIGSVVAASRLDSAARGRCPCVAERSGLAHTRARLGAQFRRAAVAFHLRYSRSNVLGARLRSLSRCGFTSQAGMNAHETHGLVDQNPTHRPTPAF